MSIKSYFWYQTKIMAKRVYLSVVMLVLFSANISAQNNDSIVFKKIANEVLIHGKCYNWLDYLSNRIGGRLSGSPQAALAVKYTRSLMDSIGADTAYLQECKVPHWVRGEKEVGKLITGKEGEIIVKICALGGSIATPAEGITGEVVEIDNFDDLKKLGRAGLEGKIVFYNRAFDETKINTFEAYGGAVDQRWSGPSLAAKYGAVGTIVRSMTNIIDDNPHTGVMKYNDSLPKVPCCAISTKGAELLSGLLKKESGVKFHFKMSCQTLPDETSYNVVGEIRGTEHPEEIITIGGHLDSWDLAQGSNDDGAGAVQSLEVLRTFKALGIKPKRTIRVVMFMNEENGGRGGAKYAELAKLRHEHLIAAIESDAGGGTPLGFGMVGKDDKKAKIRSWAKLFLPYGVYDFTGDEAGADIDKLDDQGATLMGLEPDSQRYFDVHHAATDTFDRIDKRELELGAASMTMMAYMLSQYGL